jgi:hypothetical protein
MDAIRLGVWLCEQSLGSLMLIWFVPLMVLFGVVWAWHERRPIERGLWKRRDWLMFSHVLFFPAMIVLGVVYKEQARDFERGYPYGSFGPILLDALLLGSVASCGLWILRMKGFRWPVAFLMGLMEVPILLAWFVAGCSMTWNWL